MEKEFTPIMELAEEVLAKEGQAIDDQLGSKQTAGKLPIELLPWPAIMEVVRVLEFGAQKYDDWNWSKGVKYMSLLASAMRHIIKFICGEDRDDESGLPHTAHAMCNLMFLTHFHMMGMDEKLDDRPAALKNGMCTISEPNQTLWAKYAGFLKK